MPFSTSPPVPTERLCKLIGEKVSGYVLAPTGIMVGGLVTALILIGWYRQGIFLALVVGIGNGLNVLIGDYVQRPRPSPAAVHVDIILKYNSFPSGHTCHMMLFYGFLLYLSFTKVVRGWPYRWLLVPFQAFALLNILLMGYSRVYQGEHWLGDVLGGYLSGTLWLTLFIFLYHLTTRMVERRHTKREETTSNPREHFPRSFYEQKTSSTGFSSTNRRRNIHVYTSQRGCCTPRLRRPFQPGQF